ncbi:hypothetical protein KEM55_009210 [Ascosphaera atra]|nr:hypothetical protein KEM55_009210 [Ascosphaera atra]
MLDTREKDEDEKTKLAAARLLAEPTTGRETPGQLVRQVRPLMVAVEGLSGERKRVVKSHGVFHPHSLSPARCAMSPPFTRPAQAFSVGLHPVVAGPVLPQERCLLAVLQHVRRAVMSPSAPPIVELTPAGCLPPPPSFLTALGRGKLEGKKAARAAVTAAAAPPVAPSGTSGVARSLSPAGCLSMLPFLAVQKPISL